MRGSSKRKVFLSTTALLVTGLALPAQAQDNSWNYDTVTGGTVTKDITVPGTTNILVSDGNASVEGNADIYAGHTVNVTGDDGRTFAYRDNRDNIESVLNGTLNSNMRVVVIDKDGLFFTNGSVINVQSLVATTGDIGNADIMDGDNYLTITNTSDKTITQLGKINAEDVALIARNVWNDGDIVVTKDGGRILIVPADQIQLALDHSAGATHIDTDALGIVLNTGTMNAGQAGLAAIVSPFIVNNGVITAKMGTATLASGDTVTLDMYGDGLVEVAVDGELADALVQNNGTIAAEGGLVDITAKAAKNTLDNLVNNNGIITASSASVEDGKIVLSGGDHGTVRNNGKVETSAGGEVEISGERYVQGGAANPIYSTVVTGGGDVKIATTGNVEIEKGYIDANGGDITIENDGVFFSKDKNTLRTTVTGEIALNQNKEDDAADPVAKIQNAIDAIQNTGTGMNTLNVGAGTYNEAVTVNQANMTLKGANAGKHGSDATRGAETVIVPNSPGIYVNGVDNVTIDGFEIVGGDSGVRVNNADNVSILNNIIHDQFHASAEGNSFGGYATGDGIFIQNADNALVDGNFIYGMNDDGIHAVEVSNLSVTNNAITDFTGNGDEGIAIAYASGTTTVDGNFVTGSRRDGIQLNTVEGTSNVTNNYIVHSGNAGISLVNVNGETVVDDNKIGWADEGIDIVNSANILIGDTDGENDSGNIIHHAKTGIKIGGSDGLTIEDNNIFIVGDGISSGTSDNLYIKDNAIEAINRGIVLNSLNYASAHILDNSILSGGDGILATGGMTGAYLNISGDTTGNTIMAGGDGIRVEGGVDQSTVDVKNNYLISGYSDGVEVEGNLSGGSVITIADNSKITSLFGDGVDVTNTGVSGESSVFVQGNKIYYTGDNGVEIDNVDGVSVYGNLVYLPDGNGVAVTNSDNAAIQSNIIVGAGANGIFLASSDNAAISGNDIAWSDVDGIHVEDANGTSITDNSISYSLGDGIDVSGGSQYLISANNIIGTGDNGVEASDVEELNIAGNVIGLTGNDGIFVENSSQIGIYGNTISKVWQDGIDIHGGSHSLIAGNNILMTGDSGIEIEDHDFSNVDGNTIGLTQHDGIYAYNADALNVTGNTISYAGGNGVTVADSALTNIQNNDILRVQYDGILGYNNTQMDISGNNIGQTGDDGIDLTNVSYSVVQDNTISESGENGVQIYGGGILDVSYNTISYSGEDGIYADGVYGIDGELNSLRIANNTIGISVDDGVDVRNSDIVDILDNTISFSGDDGVAVEYTNFVTVGGNTIDQSGDDGVYIIGSGYDYMPAFASSFEGEGEPSAKIALVSGNSAIVDGNDITNSGGDGIQIVDLTHAEITDNDVSTSYQHGLYVSGYNNGYVQVQSNLFTDNGQDSGSAAARFESGDIDVSNLDTPNTFVNTTDIPAVAMQFDDIGGGYDYYPEEGEFQQEAFYYEGGYYGGTGLRIVNETLGSTNFNGYKQDGSFYVRFEDGSILNPVTLEPIVIDGTFANWDGVVPNTFGNILPAPVLQAIEDRLYDADDLFLNGRGQIFVGALPTPDDQGGLDNIQDFFREFVAPAQTANNASATILGLPSLGFGNAPFNPANIEPQAGGEGGENGAGVAGIEPAAGGEGEQQEAQQVKCWGDAVNTLGTSNAPVTFNFGGTFEDSIESASECQSAQL